MREAYKKKKKKHRLPSICFLNSDTLYSVSVLCFFLWEVMAKLPTMLSLTHLLVLSLALNVSFVLRMVYKSEEYSCLKTTRSRLDISSPSSSSSSYSTPTNHPKDKDRVINLDHGDPTMYERYWREKGEKARITIPGWESMSYIMDRSKVCWFLDAEFEKEVVRLHRVVGNAVTEGRHIVVGTGSSQLILAALYALSPRDASEPINVVSAAPYYSSYPPMADYQKSGLYKWGGDAERYEKEGPYIELVTSPNNPDGHTRRSVVNRSEGHVVYDFAYYWPQYTPISSPADHDLSLFTLSKSTGHAGIRLGWALVKDREVAKRMTKFIELNTIGVSKDAQLRAAKVMRVVSDSCENQEEAESFFEFNYKVMVQRWKQLRAVVERGGLFTLPTFSPAFCNFFGQLIQPQPGFAWLKCEGEIEDCEVFLKQHKILTRSGKHFGVSPKYVRVSMLDTDETFIGFIDRLSTIHP